MKLAREKRKLEDLETQKTQDSKRAKQEALEKAVKEAEKISDSFKNITVIKSVKGVFICLKHWDVMIYSYITCRI